VPAPGWPLLQRLLQSPQVSLQACLLLLQSWVCRGCHSHLLLQERSASGRLQQMCVKCA
jgi:hypothetical protein